MNKTKLFILFLILIVAAGVLVPATSYAITNQTLIERADKLREDASKAKSTKLRDKQYGEAVKLYERVAKKKDTDFVDAATARYKLAQLYEKAQGKKYDQEINAVKYYQDIARDYDKPFSELKGDYTPEEAAELKTVGEQAAQDRKRLVGEIDKKNSTKWQYKLWNWLVGLTGKRPSFSYWFAILLFSVFVKLLLTPLNKMQFKSMREMQKIQPYIKELQEKYKNDPQTLNQKQWALYKEHGVSPFASCLPLLVQFPVLLYLYQFILIYQYQFEQGGFLWIGSSLSHWLPIPWPITGHIVWLTARNLAEPDLILVVLYLISMFISQRLTIVDPQQAEQQKMMSIMFPIMFGFMFAGFQSAFILYWLLSNVLQTGHQMIYLKKAKEEDAAAAASAGGAQPSKPAAEKPASENKETGRVRPSQRSRSRRRKR